MTASQAIVSVNVTTARALWRQARRLRRVAPNGALWQRYAQLADQAESQATVCIRKARAARRLGQKLGV